MPHYAGLDVSKRFTSICIVDADGAVVEEAVVPTEPKDIVGALRGKRRRYGGIGLEAGTIPTWLHESLVKARLPAVLMETRHTHRVLAARLNKTDKNDARGIAELIRTRAFRPVHQKSEASRRLRTLLTARKLLIGKQIDIERCIRDLLMLHGRRLEGHRKSLHYEQRVRRLLGRDQNLTAVIDPLLATHAVMRAQTESLTRRATELANDDPICRRLMTAPCVGPLTALEFRAVVDDPSRFNSSRSVGAHLGLTPRTFQSGEEDWSGRISRRGDAAARVALFNAARGVLFRMKKPSTIRTWGLALADRKGSKKATIAVARRLAVTLHSMWKSETDYQWEPLNA